ncbi:MAG: DUF971 domain-containing protein [Planctomycetota bacterium]
MAENEPVEPVGVELQDSRGRLLVRWSDGAETSAPYRELRLACRCALCVDELSGAPLLDPNTVPAGVGVSGCEEVGLYGLRIAWDDGHSTGIYTWRRLRALAGAPQAGGPQEGTRG